MSDHDPRTLPIFDIHWWDAFDHEGMIDECLRDTSLIHNVTSGRISKKTKRIIQIVREFEPDVPMDQANCDYTNIPRVLVFKIERHIKETARKPRKQKEK